jgi:hypothetical protein
MGRLIEWVTRPALGESRTCVGRRLGVGNLESATLASAASFVLAGARRVVQRSGLACERRGERENRR